jgi:hypothetical protein
MNEEITEELTLRDLGIDKTQPHQEFELIIKGQTEDYEIKEILEKAGGKSKRKTKIKARGRPEYIIRLKNKREVLLIECKADRDKHESPHLDKPKDFNVDGTLHYAEHFKERFDTIFLVVSGAENLKVSWSI